MSTNQDSNQTQAPKSTTLCKMGCGFFGSEATGNCCSKCWMQSIKTEPAAAATPSPPPVASAVSMVCSSIEEEEAESVSPMEVDAPPKVEAATSAPSRKKKKKKQSYKNMMNTMLAGDQTRDLQKEQREKISQGVGGGAFTKIEKI